MVRRGQGARECRRNEPRRGRENETTGNGPEVRGRYNTDVG